MEDFKKLVGYCRGKKLFIQTHNYPDPDAIASAFGLQRLFEHFGIPSIICCEGRIEKVSSSKMLTEFPIKFCFSDELEDIGMAEADPIICVDSQKHSGNITDFIGDEIACIDHHPTVVPIEYLYKDVRMVGACATIITDYYRRLGITPDCNVATALLYGIKMDTLQFTRGVTAADIEAFAYLHPIADNALISKLELNTLELSDLKAFGAAITNIKTYDTLGIAAIPFSCPDARIAMLSDFILSLNEIDVAVLYSYREDGIKFSVRSEISEVHAGKLIRKVLDGIGEGGGHAQMAGGFIPNANAHLLGSKTRRAIMERVINALPIKLDLTKNARVGIL